MSSLRARAFSELLTFTRATTGTYCDSAGVLRTAAAGVPRIEYDPTTLAARGLLIEPSVTNLLLRSQELEYASWSKVRASTVSNVVYAPDGTKTADKIVEDSTVNDTHYILQSYTKGSASETQEYSASIWVKAGERSVLRLLCQGTSGSAHSAYVQADLGAGTIGAVTVNGNWDRTTARLEAWPNGWYRVMLSFRIVNDGQAAVQFICALGSGSTITYTGNGTSGLYVWGAQLEKALYPTSYIPTTTATVTRNADVCNTDEMTPWYDEVAGTLFAEFLVLWTSTESAVFPRLAQLSDSDGTDYVQLFMAGSTNYANAAQSGVSQASMNLSAFTPGVVRRTAVAWKDDDAAAVATGQNSVMTDTSFDLPAAATRLSIGSVYGGSNQPSAYLRKIRFYPRRLSNAELLALVA